MSGRKFSGITTVTERYVCTLDPYLRIGGSTLNYWPTLVNGSIYNMPTGGYDRSGNHDYMADGTSVHGRLRLRGRKVVKVHAVRDIYGEIIDPSMYYLVDHSVLQSVPNSTWRPCNVEVSYTYGTPPPTAGRAAARVLATELVKLYENDDTCALPQRVTSISRQGVSYTVLDNQDFIAELRTGLYAVDLFLKTANPDKARARARVFSPDTPRARRIVGEAPSIPLSAFDLVVNEDGGAVLLYLDEIGADFLLDDNSWTISAVVSDYMSNKITTLEDATDLDRVAGTLAVSSSYAETMAAIGTKNPGILTVYATRPSLGNPEIDEVISLLESNVIIRLGERTKPIAFAN
jgi:hypothetical protein